MWSLENPPTNPTCNDVQHAVAASHGQRARQGVSRTVQCAAQNSIASDQITADGSCTGEKRAADECKPVVKGGSRATGDTQNPATAAAFNLHRARLDIHRARCVEGCIGIHGGRAAASRFAERPVVVEGRAAEVLLPAKSAVGLRVPRAVVVNLRAAVAVDVSRTPVHSAIVGQDTAWSA